MLWIRKDALEKIKTDIHANGSTSHSSLFFGTQKDLEKIIEDDSIFNWIPFKQYNLKLTIEEVKEES